MKEIHCSNCGRFLMKAAFGKFEIKCPNSKCKTINKIKLTSYKYLLTATDEQGTLKT